MTPGFKTGITAFCERCVARWVDGALAKLDHERASGQSATGTNANVANMPLAIGVAGLVFGSGQARTRQRLIRRLGFAVTPPEYRFRQRIAPRRTRGLSIGYQRGVQGGDV